MKVHSGEDYSIDTDTELEERGGLPKPESIFFFNCMRKMRRRTHTGLSRSRCVINLEIVYKYVS